MPSGSITITDPNVNISVGFSDDLGIDYTRTSAGATNGVSAWINDSSATVFASTGLEIGDTFYFWVTVTDLVGNQTNISVSVTYDPRPRVIAVSPLDNTWVASASPDLYADFSVQIGILLDVTITIDGTEVDTEVVGSQLFTQNINLADGAHAVEVVGWNADELTSQAYDWTFSVDTAAPNIVASNLDVIQLGATMYNIVTNHGNTAQFQVTDPPVNDFYSGVQYVCVYEVEMGNPSIPSTFDGYTLTVPNLADGIHTLDVYATDYAGNESDVYEVTFYVDAVKPIIVGGPNPGQSIRYDVPLYGNIISGGNAIDIPSFSVSYGSYATDGASFVVWSYPADNLMYQQPDGDVTVYLSVADIFGLQSDTVTWTFKIDSTPPQFGTSPEYNDDLPLEGATACLSISDASAWYVLSVTENVNGTQQAVSYAQTTDGINLQPDGNGTHSYTVDVIDDAGNESTDNWNVVVNRPLPVVIAVSPLDNSWVTTATPDLYAEFTVPVGTLSSGTMTINGDSFDTVK